MEQHPPITLRRRLYNLLVAFLLMLVISPCIYSIVWTMQFPVKEFFTEQFISRVEYPNSILESEYDQRDGTFDLYSNFYLTGDSKSDVLAYYEDRDERNHLIDGNTLEWEVFTTVEEFTRIEGALFANIWRLKYAHVAQCEHISYECLSTIVLTMPDASVLIVISYWVFSL